MINYGTQSRFTHLPNCRFFHSTSNVPVSTSCHVSDTFSLELFPPRDVLEVNSGGASLRSDTPTRVTPSPSRQPSPRLCVKITTLVFGRNRRQKGSVALVRASRQADSHSDIYTVIPLLIALNIFIEGKEKAGWRKNGGIYDSQRSRLIHFLITGKYIGIACPALRFRAKTNAIVSTDPC